MAIVFASPVKKHYTAIYTAIAVTVVLLMASLLIIFFPEINNKFTLVSFMIIQPNSEITIPFDVVDSPMVQKLEPFDQVGIIFNYTVKDNNGKQTAGQIQATSRIEAQNMLQQMGFNVITLQEQAIGRSNPFADASAKK